ncbi:hypothetical protein PPMP20_27390 [Paraburkholderia phymatum]|uniref:hypothetical protein n=1 Tax=Paraburkholderia phymatum TaxID=148447 RepID=UPI001FCA0E0C|nr:hypothetical protein [Paraburkholderia phymatum]
MIDYIAGRIGLIARRNPVLWVAGALLLLHGAMSFARRPFHAPAQRHDSALILFYSYPVAASPAYAPFHHVRRYAVQTTMQWSAVAYGLPDSHNIAQGRQRFRHGSAPGNPYLAPLEGAQAAQSSALPSYGFGLPSDAQSVPPTAASNNDDWSFRANPLLNLNHAHERGATFSIRHDF